MKFPEERSTTSVLAQSESRRVEEIIATLLLYRNNLDDRRATTRMTIGGRGGEMIVAARQ